VTPAAALRAGLGAVLLGLLLLAAIPAGQRAFSADDSVEITSPAALAIVPQPLSVSWRGPTQRYAVFVDVSSIPVGGSLRDLADRTCKRQPACQPSPETLQTLGVYVTTGHQVTVTGLVKLHGVGAKQKHPIHTATLVIVDSSGRRVGAAGWRVQFRA
jgi:hypothetical protein